MTDTNTGDSLGSDFLADRAAQFTEMSKWQKMQFFDKDIEYVKKQHHDVVL